MKYWWGVSWGNSPRPKVKRRKGISQDCKPILGKEKRYQGVRRLRGKLKGEDPKEGRKVIIISKGEVANKKTGETEGPRV